VSDDEVLAGVDVVVVVEPRDDRCRLTADDTVQRHLRTVASRHAVQLRRERRRYRPSVGKVIVCRTLRPRHPPRVV